jgi:hypothetical protein
MIFLAGRAARSHEPLLGRQNVEGNPYRDPREPSDPSVARL